MSDLLMSTRAYLQKGLYKEKDLRDAADLIQKCVTWVPNNRLTAEEALAHPFLVSLDEE